MSPAGPIRVDFIPAKQLGLSGRLGLTSAPGRWRPDGPAEPLRGDLKVLREHHGATVLVTLMEPFEFASYGISDLPAAVRGAGIEHLWFPVADMSVPLSLAETRQHVEGVIRRLREGETVVVHCLGGLGRSGTIAACVLVATGRRAQDAIDVVRTARPGAVQTPAQEAFVGRFEREARAPKAGKGRTRR